MGMAFEGDRAPPPLRPVSNFLPANSSVTTDWILIILGTDIPQDG